MKNWRKMKTMGKQITLDANGNIITLDDKNTEILKNLQPTLENQLRKKETNMYLKKPFQLKFGSVITNKLIELFRSYGLMRQDDIQGIDANDLQDYYLHFMALINQVSQSIEITPTKPLFCAYMGITVRVYNSFEKSKDDDIRFWLDAINGDLTHALLDSSMNGNASEKSSLTFASTKEYGQEIVQNDFNATITTRQEVEFTPKQALDSAHEKVALIEEMKNELNHKIREKRK